MNRPPNTPLPRGVLALSQLLPHLDSHSLLHEASPLGRTPYLLVDLSREVLPGDAALLLQPLRHQPCPVIGITPAPELLPPEVAACFDTLVADSEAAAPLEKNIRANPMAAMTLVQLLRLTEKLGVEEGLLAESLAYATLQGGAEARACLAARKRTAHRSPEQELPLLVQREESRLTITLNRPAHRNAYSVAMRDALLEALELLALDSSIKQAVLNGNGSCFCTGGDLTEFGTAPDTATAHTIRSVHNAARMIHRQAHRIEAHLHGACIGSGIELPAFAGRVIANPDTFFQLPEVALGLIPGAGGTVSITRRIGRHRMAWLTLSARKINARTALAWGLVDETPSVTS